MRAYSDPKRESDPHALPDVEVFYDDEDRPPWGGEPRNFDSQGRPVAAGWYWWSCFTGCLPAEPVGPFATQAEALADAQKGAAE